MADEEVQEEEKQKPPIVMIVLVIVGVLLLVGIQCLVRCLLRDFLMPTKKQQKKP